MTKSESSGEDRLPPLLPRLKMVGGYFCGTELPEGIEPAVIQELVKGKRAWSSTGSPRASPQRTDQGSLF